ncbi:MAG: protease family protein [Chloroflexota bacterium]|nr:protease family protein [Chloroflexota bacterium]
MKFLDIFWNRELHRLRLFWRLTFYILFIYLSFFLFSLLVTLTGTFAFFNSRIGNGLMEIGLALLAVWAAGRLLDRRHFAEFGFRFDRNWLKDLAFGLALGAFLMAVIFLAEWALGWVHIRDFFGTNTALSSLPTRADFWNQFGQSLIFYILAAAAEELFFRAYPFINMVEGFQNKRINQQQAAWLAAILTSAVFGLAHLGNPHANWISTLNIVLSGIMLCLGFIYNGQAALSIGLHFTWNFFQGVIFGFPVSGTLSSANLIRIEQQGAELWTGGAFGPEAGLVGVAAMLLGCLLIVLYFKRRRAAA